MKKSDFKKFLKGDVTPIRQSETTHMSSVTDPTYAQSVAEMLSNPLPYEVKNIYSNGVPADQMQAFDGMYKDKHEAFQAAREYDAQEHQKVNDWKKKQEEEKKNKDNPQEPQE